MNTNYGVGDYVYDAQIYDGLNSKIDDLVFYKKVFSKFSGVKILELCCGTGRLTIPLFESGFSITGIDLSTTMLEEAKRKSAEKGYKIPMLYGDMRSFSINTEFDAVFIPFNSIHHLYSNEDLFSTLHSAHEHLVNDGCLIIDYFNPNIRYIVENENKSVSIGSYTTQDGRKVVVNQTMKYEDDTQINRIKWQYIINNSEHSTQSLDMRIFYPRELDFYIESHNLKIIDKYGDYDMSEFKADSPKQLIICRKGK